MSGLAEVIRVSHNHFLHYRQFSEIRVNAHACTDINIKWLFRSRVFEKATLLDTRPPGDNNCISHTAAFNANVIYPNTSPKSSPIPNPNPDPNLNLVLT